jgi:hypothetical protein
MTTNCYKSERHSPLSSCYAVVILLGAQGDVPERVTPSGQQCMPGNAGIIEQGLPYTPPTHVAGHHRYRCLAVRNDVSEMLQRPGLLRPTTCSVQKSCGRTDVRESRSSSRVVRGAKKASEFLYEHDARRSIVNRNWVNCCDGLALSSEMCSKFLNELAAPVNIWP